VRQPPRPPLKPYILWGYIAADSLPDRLDFGRIRIAREYGERLASLSKARPSVPTISSPDMPTYTSGSPADLSVRSDRLIWVRVDALNENEAYRKAVEHYLPPVLATLAGLTSGPVLVDLVRVSTEDENGNMPPAVSPFSPSVSFRGFRVSVMSQADCGSLQHQASVAARDQVARSAARDIAEAIRLRYLTGGVAANLQSTLLRFFFVVEHIAREVGYDKERNLTAEKEQQGVVDKLRAGLNKGGETKQLTKQLRKASQDLDALERRFLSTQITQAGQVLRIEPRVVQRALDLAKLRNSRLGHAARSDVPNEEFESWLEDAELVARSFYGAYIRHLAV
jgi:hypothetical protein